MGHAAGRDGRDARGARRVALPRHVRRLAEAHDRADGGHRPGMRRHRKRFGRRARLRDPRVRIARRHASRIPDPDVRDGPGVLAHQRHHAGAGSARRGLLDGRRRAARHERAHHLSLFAQQPDRRRHQRRHDPPGHRQRARPRADRRSVRRVHGARRDSSPRRPRSSAWSSAAHSRRHTVSRGFAWATAPPRRRSWRSSRSREGRSS